MLDDLLRQYAEELELPALAFVTDTPGVFSIPLEKDVTIKLESLPDGFAVTSNFMTTPKTNLEPFYTELLHANLFGQATRGATLALTRDGNQVILSRIVNLAITYKDFKDVLEDFIHAIDFWRSKKS